LRSNGNNSLSFGRVFLFALLLWLPQAQAVAAALSVVARAELPVEARETLRLIHHGGPFPYTRDGVEFRNYERILPKQHRGYYHEYTVRTPGVKSRGARRIVCGPLPECYYTADHYRHFNRIQESE
jgi:ribonuclease T1